MLHEHLIYCKNLYKVYVKSPGSFLATLEASQTHHTILGFKKVTVLYLKIFLQFLFSNIQSLYVNEGGHIRYVKLLASLFPSKKFIIHMRLIEDTKCRRIRNNIPTNLQCICVSHFIENEIIKNNPLVRTDRLLTVHDYYLADNKVNEPEEISTEVIKVGVIGRVSSAKGISKANRLFSYWEKSVALPLECYFYGDVIDDEDVLDFKKNLAIYKIIKVYLKGFERDKNKLFDNFNILIHFNEFEPFPRVYFDAMARFKPVTGFDSGGIAEQAQLFSFVKNLVSLDENWEKNMAGKIIEINESLNEQRMEIFQQRHVFTEVLNINTYIKKIESHL